MPLRRLLAASHRVGSGKKEPRAGLPVVLFCGKEIAEVTPINRKNIAENYCNMKKLGVN